MGRAGLTPDALTLIGFGITVVGAVLLAVPLWLLGGIVVFIGGAFDMFDGTLARATGKVSPLGAFMDSVFDRAGEVIVYLGVVAGLLRDGIWDVALLAAAAMGAAVMVSYTRSKSEGLGFTEGAGMAAVGIMTREIRLVILAIGLILAGVLGVGYGDFTGDGGLNVWPGTWALTLALGIITLGSVITVIQRILHVRSQANQPAPSRPTEQEHP
jgi:CDP-diacylglycerol---glycerol-3-phosphate 3-phosphatidyltransferase